MKKNYYLCTLMLAGGMFLFSGCASTETNSKGTKDTKEQIEITDAGKSEMIQESDYGYAYETDCQSNRPSYSTTVYTKEGRYETEGMDGIQGKQSGSYLQYFDYATGETVYVCGKSNCEHSSDSCNAYFKEENFPMGILWNYEGDLYTPMIEEEYIWICKISPDGAVREKICKVMRQYVEEKEDGDEISTRYYMPEMQIHRGYVYFTDYYMGCEEATLYRIKLETNAQVESLYEVSGKGTSIYRIKPYGKYVLFQMGKTKEDSNEIIDSIYAYHTESAEVSCVCQNSYKDFMVLEQNLYYIDSAYNIKRKNLTDGKEEIFYKAEKNSDKTISVRLFDYDKKIVYETKTVSEEKSTEQSVLDTTGKVCESRKEANDDILLAPYTMLADK
ncbi:MAG: hypothetical protein II992_11635 [Lachnospiraceae bacterium]|nr:hypothetical protein [Lachnospiraceae bacterium]